ncbi:putative serine/threonine protein kinase IREH1 [Raphanus sativus]|nr:putative serine/threonine protein kinase IREH1 [Raphanus sativus]
MKFTKLKKLFCSSKKVDSANSPENSASESESDKRKRRSNPKEETRSPNWIFGFAAGLKEFTKKHWKRAFSSDQVHSSVPLGSYLSSSLGSSNRIKTRSLRVTLETCFSFRNNEATPVALSHDLPGLNTRQDSDKSKVSPPCDSGKPENQMELEPPHFQALPHKTSAPSKSYSRDNKSFSQELNAEGVRPFPLRKPDRSNSWEEVLNLIKATFDKAKEEVNVDLKQFSEDLVRISKDNAKNHHELKVIIGNLMILTLKCTKTTSGEFWVQCEEIFQELDVKWHELPPGVPKQLHTRLLFILMRCTRLLQFQFLKESWGQEEEFAQRSQSGPLSCPYYETSLVVSKEQNDNQVKVVENRVASTDDMSIINDKKSIICRICEEDVPTTHVEDHSKICELSDRYGTKGVSVDARLEEVASTLDIIMENISLTAVESPMEISPRPDPFESLLGSKVTFHDRDDIPLMIALANIARRAANAISHDDQSMKVLLSCLYYLRLTIDSRNFDALTVETFGIRIEKLIRDKYLQLNEILDDEKVDLSSTVIDEDVLLADEVDQRSLRTRSVRMRDRISIDDFEEIKEISRGAYGRVLLAKKRTTGDIFAIKVVKKADMIRKNAVERIHAELDILSNVRNPFVVLALEYLHSEGIVHRDLKPDNLLMAHDGHVKLTDFGLSEVGLIDSTGDLSGPKFSTSEHNFERRDRPSAVGTPDYMAPEILLGKGHGATADWWSVGIILFEFIVGIPPFNADNPEQIFDNIINRKITWPSVPEEMSYEARDLIDRLLTEDPHQRLGARGAAEVKQHIFFKDINWDTLPEQKAVYVPDTVDALDTSYFQSRYASDKRSSPTSENGNSCESGSSGCHSNDHNDGVMFDDPLSFLLRNIGVKFDRSMCSVPKLDQY